MGVPDWLERTELLIGEESIHKLKNAQILLVGLGGVGSYAGEFLVRAGIGSLIIIDGDRVDPTNINRQMQALHSTIGMSKAELLRQRFLDINPGLQIEIHTSFMEPADMELLLQQVEIDFVLDCIDSVLPKLTLIKAAVRAKVKVISAMGAGGKFDPSKVKVADISKTRECKFAQTVRKRLKYLGIRKGILTVYSEEIQPKSALQYTDGSAYKRSFYGTISYMPALFGLRMAAEAISRIIKA
jgi:tRNA A37 threonylcarbamoyladenosine dehydratase